MDLPNNDKPSIPDPSSWYPRATSAQETLARAFELRCENAEELILRRALHERTFNVDNFDSGPGVEDIVREQIAAICPNRYSIRPAVVSDRDGRTAGEVDIAIHNDVWFPEIKTGSTDKSRRTILPIESIYAVIEVKQTLTCETLEDAFKKLVACHRLTRPFISDKRITENRDLGGCSPAPMNMLFSGIIATRVGARDSFQSLIDRFFDISKLLHRKDLVRCMTVLGEGTVTWGTTEPDGGGHMAIDDFFTARLVPVWHRAREGTGALHPMITNLLTHMYRSVLAPEDISAHYAPSDLSVSVPNDDVYSLDPDGLGWSGACDDVDWSPLDDPSLPYDATWDPFGPNSQIARQNPLRPEDDEPRSP